MLLKPLRPLATAKQVAASYAQLKRLVVDRGVRFYRNIGWPSGNGDFSIYWQPRLKFWVMFQRQQSLYWCGYGLQDPRESGSLQFTVQINPARHPSARRTGGGFFQDENGKVYLCHNGILTKGHASLGKDRFIADYDGDLGTVEWPDGSSSPVVIIAGLDDGGLLRKVSYFIKQVERFKASLGVTLGTSERDLHNLLFTPEFAGAKQPYSGKRKIAPMNLHGFVFKALKTALKPHGRTNRTALIDLFLFRNEQMTHLFEIKTGTDRTSVYAGVGQLMLHGALEHQAPSKVLVLPGEPKGDTRERLRVLGITVLQYSWRGLNPVFLNLQDVLA